MEAAANFIESGEPSVPGVEREELREKIARALQGPNSLRIDAILALIEPRKTFIRAPMSPEHEDAPAESKS
jgi:hypothetical protein